jgi:quercetin dioxygenase-like cupin family protein
MPDVCAKEEVVITVAKRIVINGINIFMTQILPAANDNWQVTSAKISHRINGRGSKYGRISAISPSSYFASKRLRPLGHTRRTNIVFHIDFLLGNVLKMKRENSTIEICPGITRRTVAHGKNMYQMMATLAAGSTMPAHSHPQEQIVHILEGQMRLIVDGVPHELSTGDSFYLASNVPHGVETLLPTRVLDTFSPPRKDYLAIDEKVRHGAL